jgi:predicted homoserine dehydrogenase-like protein
LTSIGQIHHRQIDRRGCDGADFNQGKQMQIGMIGLGRMGANMVRRLMQGGHECVVRDV